MFERFTDRARRVVVLAQEEARMLGHNHIGTEHVLLGLLREGEGLAARALEALGVGLEAVRQQVEGRIGRGHQAQSGHIPFTARAKKVLELSLREALLVGHDHIGTEHILLALIGEGDGVAVQVLVGLGADLDRIRQQVMQLLPDGVNEPARAEPARAEAAHPALTLGGLGRTLTQEAREGRLDFWFLRAKDTERVMEVLSRRTENNAVLIAEPGSGKMGVAEGLARRIATGDAPASLADKELYTLDVDSLAMTAPNQPNLQQLMTDLGQIGTRGDILFIDDLHLLLGASSPESITAVASLIKPMLMRGTLQLIGATTLDEYQRYLEQDAALERKFQRIDLAEMTVSQTIEMLKGQRDRYEAYHRVSITDNALVAAAQLADRYIDDRFLPDKAIDLIDEAGSRMRIRRLTAPPDLREYDNKIARVRQEKESAINSADFEKAAALRDTEKQLLAKKATREKEWKAGDMGGVAEVNEDLIVEIVASLSAVPIQRILEQQRADIMRLTEPRAVVPVDRSQRYALLNDKPSDNAKTDLLGTSEAAQTIASVLIKSRGSSPFVMAIDGGWGIGKSTLLRQIEANLAHEKDLVCVRFNAWTAEGSNALEGLIKSVLGQLDPNTLRRSMRWLSKQQGVAGIARVLTMVAAHFLGVTRLVDELWSKLAIDAKSRNEMRELIGNMLTQWTQQDGKADKALVVFIDDLDRCTDETIIQVCEAVKLYLDSPGLIFVLACDLSVLARGAATSARGGIGEGRAYLEKIIQVAYRIPPPDETKIKNLIRGCGEQAGVSPLLDDMITGILALRAGRNPRKIKRIINSFVLEYQLNPEWQEPPLDSSLLVITVLLQHLYSSFYDYLVSEGTGDDPVGAFLDYVAVTARAASPPPSDHAWWAVARRTFQEYKIPPPDRSPGTSGKLMGDLQRLEELLPDDFPALARSADFVALLRSIGDKDTRLALRAQLLRRPLASEAVDHDPPLTEAGSSAAEAEASVGA